MSRSKRQIVLVALVVGLAATGPSAGQQEEVEWLTLDFPPFFIHRGPDRADGIADRALAMIQAELDDVRHSEQVATTAEIFRRMSTGDRVCSPAYIWTEERARAMAYSVHHLVLPPIGLTVRRDAAERFGRGPVSLAALLAAGDLKLAVARGRSYGPGIDPVLQRFKGSDDLYSRMGEDIFEGLFDLLLKGSVNAILGYPYESFYVAREKGAGEAVKQLDLVESSDYIKAHVVCSGGDWGERMIDRIDDVLLRIRGQDRYREAVERWLSEESKTELRRQYELEMTTP